MGAFRVIFRAAGGWCSPPTALIFLVLVASARTAPPPSKELTAAANAISRADDDPYRLPRSLLPLQYTLRLVPDLEKALFHGRVEIQVEAQEVTRNITLHAEGIEFGEISVTRQKGGASDANMYEDIDKKPLYEMVDIILNDDLVPNENYTIDIDYAGTLRDNMYGFYISSYTDKSGEIKKLAATQFQATHARKAFPCFDEPSFKAQFQVSVFAPPGYHALGNMPVYKTENVTENDLAGTEYFFLNSMTMSPYLLAFVVSDFIPQDDGVENEVTFTTWARENAMDGAEYSLKVSRLMLAVLEGYTEIPYKNESLEFPLNKVDQVALPDFAAGAMENWGLITYRETALLYNDGSADAKKRVATVIAHELLHMWFGNLITTYWWDTTWLNEGFARYFQYYVTDKVETSWRMWDQFVVDQHQMVFALDALVTAKALTHKVSSPADASASFGTISYSKGGSILRMISYVIGEDNFKKALQQYLENHMYSNVKPEDLFDELIVYADAAHLEEDEFVALLVSWTEKPGFPVVNVIRDYESNRVHVSQKRFLYDGESSEEYCVPLTWTAQGGDFEDLETRDYIKGNKENVTLNEMLSADLWVIFNPQETGYYRVNYDETNWKLISTHLKNNNKPLDDIHLLNRAQLLDDAFNLARANQLSYEIAFDLANYLSREADYIPWSSALTAFSFLNRMLVNHEKYPAFKRYVLRLIDQAYQHFHSNIYLNTSPEEHVKKLHMNRLVTWACSLDHKLCNEMAVDTLRGYLEDEIIVNSELRSAVYCYGIRNDGDEFWDRMWKKYTESLDDVERGLIVSGLACSTQKERLNNLLEESISDGDIRKQDASSVFTAVYSLPSGVEVALDFLNKNFDSISKYYASMGSINSIITGIAGRLTTEQQKEKFTDFVTAHKEDLEDIGDSALKIVDENLNWIQSHEDDIFKVLDNTELQQYRLPLSVKPENYTLYLAPSLEDASFTGEVSISVTAEESTKTITLHSEGINATAISVKNMTSDEELYDSHTYDVVHEFLNIHLNQELTPTNEYVINIQFEGKLRDNMYGFYLSTYFDEDGNEINLAATQFQPTYARQAFPCFDEPNFKANFTVTVNTPANYIALGNMPVSPDSPIIRDDLSTDVTFLTTPRMSTYLLAFVVSDFEQVEDPDNGDNVEFRTWARSNALSWATYSIQISRSILQTLEDYTDITYIDSELEHPFNKVDQVALPDFSAGAMENWGLITYRETMLLYNDGTASARKGIATVIAHELAHMWFGNLVTTHWWDTTWLNEGFAQYLMFFVTDKVEVDWRLMDQFVFDHHQGIMTSDALASAVALTSPAYTPSQVSGRFSSITYSKGASILRMLSAVMEEDNFRNALQSYLKSHRYSTTEPDDLFEHLIKQAHATNLDEKSFEELLRSWTEKPGFPVINVKRDYESGVADVTQTRFLLKTSVSEDTLYYVPLTWVAQGGDFSLSPPTEYLTEHSHSITNLPGLEQWVIFNVQETGFYRVNYDAANWRLLSDFLRDDTNALDEIHLLNRAQLLDDAFNLARADQLPYETVFYLTDYLPRETDYIPWASALSGFAYLQRMLSFNEEIQLLEKYVRHLIEEQYNHFNFEDRESHIEKLHLNRISSWACSVRHDHCEEKATAALHDFLHNEKTVPADLRSVVYCYGIRHSDTEHWYKVLEEYKNSLDNSERALLMAGLACSFDEERLKELLNDSISNTYIRKQDASSVFTSVYSNVKGVEVALDFLDQNFDAVNTYYGSMGAINNIVIGIAGRLTTLDQKNKMALFVDKYSDELESTAEAAMETVNENLEWLDKNEETILGLLGTYFPTTELSTETTTEGTSGLRATALAVLLLLVAGRLL